MYYGGFYYIPPLYFFLEPLRHKLVARIVANSILVWTQLTTTEYDLSHLWESYSASLLNEKYLPHLCESYSANPLSEKWASLSNTPSTDWTKELSEQSPMCLCSCQILPPLFSLCWSKNSLNWSIYIWLGVGVNDMNINQCHHLRLPHPTHNKICYESWDTTSITGLHYNRFMKSILVYHGWNISQGISDFIVTLCNQSSYTLQSPHPSRFSGIFKRGLWSHRVRASQQEHPGIPPQRDQMVMINWEHS